MTGAEFKAIRTELGCTGEAFARALGYGGTPGTRSTVTYLFETGRREIPEKVARLAAMFRDHGIPAELAHG
jgi:transcriptional regulator with XRE-family HTH domain